MPFRVTNGGQELGPRRPQRRHQRLSQWVRVDPVLWVVASVILLQLFSSPSSSFFPSWWWWCWLCVTDAQEKRPSTFPRYCTWAGTCQRWQSRDLATVPKSSPLHALPVPRNMFTNISSVFAHRRRRFKVINFHGPKLEGRRGCNIVKRNVLSSFYYTASLLQNNTTRK